MRGPEARVGVCSACSPFFDKLLRHQPTTIMLRLFRQTGVYEPPGRRPWISPRLELPMSNRIFLLLEWN